MKMSAAEQVVALSSAKVEAVSQQIAAAQAMVDASDEKMKIINDQAAEAKAEIEKLVSASAKFSISRSACFMCGDRGPGVFIHF